MKKWIFIWLLNWSLLIQAQINDGYIDTEESIQTLQYDKNLNISEERTFELTPNSKYSGDAFQYNDHIKASKPNTNCRRQSKSRGFFWFTSNLTASRFSCFGHHCHFI